MMYKINPRTPPRIQYPITSGHKIESDVILDVPRAISEVGKLSESALKFLNTPDPHTPSRVSSFGIQLVNKVYPDNSTKCVMSSSFGAFDDEDDDLLVFSRMVQPAYGNEHKKLFLSKFLEKSSLWTLTEIHNNLILAHVNAACCKCLCCRVRYGDPLDKRGHVPKPVNYLFEFTMAEDYVLSILNSIEQRSKEKSYNLWSIIVNHDLLDPVVVREYISDEATQSMKAPPVEASPTMDYVTGYVRDSIIRPSVSGVVNSEMSPVLDEARDLVERLSSSVDGMRDTRHDIKGLDEVAAALKKISIDGVQLRTDGLNNAMRDGLNINLPKATNSTFSIGSFFSEGVMSGIKGLIDSICPSIGVLFSTIENYRTASPKVCGAIALIVSASLEGLRLTYSEKSKWYHLLAFASFSICFFSGNDQAKSFAIGYYGATLIYELYRYVTDWISSTKVDPDDSEPEVVEVKSVKALATSDFNYPVLVKSFFANVFTTITGILDSLTIRDVAMALGTYKMLINGGSFALDSLVNLTMDLINLLGKPFGVEVFKRTYNKYPAIFEVVECFNECKEMLVKQELPAKPLVERFVKSGETLRDLDRRIPINNDHSVYRNFLRTLQSAEKDLRAQMKGLGLFGGTRRFTPWTFGLIGAPGTAKTNIAKLYAEVAWNQVCSPEEWKVHKDMPTAITYDMKARKFNDGLTSNHKIMIIDDFGQSKKAVEPDGCLYLKFIEIVNNNPCVINKSAAEDKDKDYVNVDIVAWTSNRKIAEAQETWCTDLDAYIRRAHGNNRCVFYLEPKAEYQVHSGTATFGYTVNDALKSKVAIDTDAYLIRRWDFKEGKAFAGPAMTHSQFVELIVDNVKAHFNKEKLLSASLKDLASDKTFNPYFIDYNEGAKATMDPFKEQLQTYAKGIANEYTIPNSTSQPIKAPDDWMEKYSAVADYLVDADFNVIPVAGRKYSFKELTTEQRDLIRKAIRDLPVGPVHAIQDHKTIADFDDIRDYVSYVFTKHEARLLSYYSQGCKAFSTKSAMLTWSLIADEKWATFVANNLNDLSAMIDANADSYSSRYMSVEAKTYVASYLSPTSVKPLFQAWFYAAVDIMSKYSRLAELYGCTVEQISRDLRSAKVSWSEFFTLSFSRIKSLMAFHFHTIAMTTWTAVGSFMNFRSVWVDGLIAYLPGLILGLTTVKQVTAVSDYTKMGKVVRNPLTRKCKIGQVVKSKCSCVDCAKLRSDSLPAVATAQYASNESKDLAKGMLRRCSWNMQLIPDPERPENIGTCSNITMVCAELGVFNNHFDREIVRYRAEYPALVIRIVSPDGKSFPVLASAMRFNRDYADKDLTFWVNDRKVACSFGGGIRNFVKHWISENDRAPSSAICVYQKFDRKAGNVCYDTQIGKVSTSAIYYRDPSSAHRYDIRAYVMPYESVEGHCGSVAMTADDMINPAKFFGIICAGSLGGDKASRLTYISGITREIIQSVLDSADIVPLDTDELPVDVVDTDLVPERFVVAKVCSDHYPINENNDITRTKLHGCLDSKLGELDMSPAFISAWEDENGIKFPISQALKKLDTNPPAVHPLLYDMAVEMAVQSVQAVLPEGNHSFELTTEEALEGAYDESPFSTKTTPGGQYMLEGITKKMIVTRNADQSLNFSSVHGKRFLNDIALRDSKLDRFVIPYDLSNMFGKVEVLPNSKIKAGRCRAVEGVGADSVISDKRILCCLSYLLKRYGLAAGMATNLDPNSYDSHIMAVMLRMYNEIQPGDHSGWDTNFFRYKYQGILKFIFRIFKDMSETHKRKIETAVFAMTYLTHIVHLRTIPDPDDPSVAKFVKLLVFFETQYGMITGSYSTLTFNTLGHYIDLRYITLIAYCKKVLGIHFLAYDPVVHGVIPFEEISKLIISFITGDDVVVSRNPVLTFLDFYSMREAYGMCNMKLTTDKKDDAEIVKPFSIDRSGRPTDGSFCKRYWVWKPEYKRWVLALDFDSLRKSIYFTDDEFKEYKQIVDTFFKELSNYGRSKFDDLAPLVDQAVYHNYGYSSPYAIYDLASASIIGRVDDKVLRPLSNFLREHHALGDVEDLKDCMDLIHSLERSEVASGGDISPGLKLVSKELNNIIEKMADSKHHLAQCVKGESGLNEIVEAKAMMDSTPVKEHLVTTTMVSDDPPVTTAGQYGERVDSYNHSFATSKDFLARPKRVISGVWDTSSAQNANLQNFTPKQFITGSGVYSNKLQGYDLFRATAVFRLQINANAFQQGALRMWANPGYDQRVGASTCTQMLIQKTQHLGVDLTCRGSEAILKIPFVAPVHYMRNGTFTDTFPFDWGRVWLTVLAPLRTEPSVGSVTVDYSIWVSYEDLEMAAPVRATMDKEEKLSSDRPISTALRAAGKIAGSLGKIPPLAPYLKPLQWSADTAARMAYTLGYSKPPQNDRTTIVSAPQLNRYAAVFDGPDTSLELGLSANNSVGIKNIASWYPNTDEMSFDYIKAKKCLFRTINLSTVSTGVIATIIASPETFKSVGTATYGPKTVTYQAYAPASHVGQMFHSWRGSFKITFQAIKTDLVSGRLAFQFNPSNSSVGSDDSNITAGRFIWDIAVNDTMSVDLPWLIRQNYIGMRDVSGNLTVEVVNKLKANASCADNIDILCWVEYNSDFELAVPYHYNADKAVLVLPGVSGLDEEYVEVDRARNHSVEAKATSDFVGDTPLGDAVIEGESTKYAEVGVGEHFDSIKQLMLRYNLVRSTTNSDIPGVMINPYFFSALTFDAGTGVYVAGKVGGDVIGYLAPMYASYRGGMRVGVTNHNVQPTSIISNLVVGLYGTQQWTQAPIDPYSNIAWYQPDTNFTANTGYTVTEARSAYVKVPYYVDTLFSYVQMSTGNDIIKTPDAPTVYANVYSGSLTGIKNMITRAVGDEFVLANFCAAPLLVVSVAP